MVRREADRAARRADVRHRGRAGVPATASHYEPRDPAQSVLFQVVRDHFETFRAQTASLREGEGPPRFVEREFREFLTCGCLAAGFALWPGAASDTSL